MLLVGPMALLAAHLDVVRPLYWRACHRRSRDVDHRSVYCLARLFRHLGRMGTMVIA